MIRFIIIIVLGVLVLPGTSLANKSDAFFLDDLEDALQVELARQGAGKDLRFDGIELVLGDSYESFALEAIDRKAFKHPFTIKQMNFYQRSGRFKAKLAVNGGGKSDITVHGKALSFATVPVLNNLMTNGEIISKQDIDWVEMPSYKVRSSVVVSADDIIGKTPRRMLREGQMIRLSELELPKLVKKGEVISIVYRTPIMELRTMGKSLDDGALGELVRVRNTKSNVVVQAVVHSAGLAIVHDSQHSGRNMKMARNTATQGRVAW